MARKLHVFGNHRQQWPSAMCERGRFKSRRELFSDCAAADDTAALQYQGMKSGARQIKCSHQCVVAAANDYNVARRGHYEIPQSCRICLAARRPGAPMMPPPGCVAEPHI